MFRIAVSLIALIATTAAVAARPSTLGMSCQQAQNLVATQGAVVMTTGPHTFQRFVSSAGYCKIAEWAEPASAPTKDARHCPLGYTCTRRAADLVRYDRGGGLFFDR